MGRFASPSRSRAALSPRESAFFACVVILSCLVLGQGLYFWKRSSKDSTLTAVLSTTHVVRNNIGTGHTTRKVTTRTNLIIDGFHKDIKYSKKMQASLVDERSKRGSSRSSVVDGHVQPNTAATIRLGVAASQRNRSESIMRYHDDIAVTELPQTSTLGNELLDGRTPPGVNASIEDIDKGVPGVEVKAHIPSSFDWEAYLLYHPELRAEGIASEESAMQHYLSVGRSSGYVYKRLRVLMRYTACGGLINQQYSHIAAFSLAAVLGAELVLAPAVKRDSFAHYFSTFKEQNEVSWTAAPLESLLDVDAVVEYWANRSMTVHKVPGLAPFPDLSQPEVAYPLYEQADIIPETVCKLEHVYLQNLDMPELVEKVRQAVVGHAAKLLKEDPDRDLDVLVLDLPCTFYMLRSLSALRVVTDVARSLQWSPDIRYLAGRVISGMQNASITQFNALHLRVEKDARDWSAIMGALNYIHAMQLAGFNSNQSVYMASGLLTYGAHHEMEHIVNTLKHHGLCSEIHYKEMYIPQEELEALNSEQKALLDFLVLAQGSAFVGFGSSTFSFYLREFRSLASIPRSTSVLVDASVIGTDPLFNSAGTVV